MYEHFTPCEVIEIAGTGCMAIVIDAPNNKKKITAISQNNAFIQMHRRNAIKTGCHVSRVILCQCVVPVEPGRLFCLGAIVGLPWKGFGIITAFQEEDSFCTFYINGQYMSGYLSAISFQLTGYTLDFARMAYLTFCNKN